MNPVKQGESHISPAGWPDVLHVDRRAKLPRSIDLSSFSERRFSSDHVRRITATYVHLACFSEIAQVCFFEPRRKVSSTFR